MALREGVRFVTGNPEVQHSKGSCLSLPHVRQRQAAGGHRFNGD